MRLQFFAVTVVTGTSAETCQVWPWPFTHTAESFFKIIQMSFGFDMPATSYDSATLYFASNGS